MAHPKQHDILKTPVFILYYETSRIEINAT